MSKLKQIIRLREKGVALQTISRSVGASRNTVKKYLRLIKEKGYSFQELLSKEDEQLERLVCEENTVFQERYQFLEKMFPYIVY